MRNIITKLVENKALAVVAALGVLFVLAGTTYACQSYLARNNDKKLAKQQQESSKPAEQKTEAPKPVEATTPAPAASPAPATAPKVAAPATKPKTEVPTKKKTETPPTGGVSSISLSGSGGSVSWNVVGYAKKGFKVVWSKIAGPTYPTRSSDEYHYLSNPSTVSDSIDGFDGPGTYFVRVCEYTGGGCGVYSNQITVSLP